MTRWVVLAAAMGLGCNRAALITPKGPDWDGGGAAKCKVKGSHSEPLVVEWPSTDRAKLEALTRQGLVAVRYVGCEMQVLGSCSAGGAYRYTPTVVKRDKVEIKDQDALFANLPFGAAKLETTLAREGQLNVAMTVVGRFQADHQVHQTELRGDCANATHAISALIVGAFEFSSGAGVNVGGGGSVFNVGIEGNTKSERRTLSVDGEAEHCEDAAELGSPPARCRALIRLELTPLPEVADRIEREEQQRQQEAERQSSARSTRRTIGYVLSGAGLVTGAASLTFAYMGSRTDAAIEQGGLVDGEAIADKEAQGQKYNTAAYVLGGLSVPLVGVGVPLVWFNSPREQEPASIAVNVRANGFQIVGALP